MSKKGLEMKDYEKGARAAYFDAADFIEDLAGPVVSDKEKTELSFDEMLSAVSADAFATAAHYLRQLGETAPPGNGRLTAS